MSEALTFAPLPSRALIGITGSDWRNFLQGLITQDVGSLRVGEARFGALLAPQGRLLYDLFVVGRDEGCWLDVLAEHRIAILQRLTMYRLRAKVELVARNHPVSILYPTPQRQGADPSRPFQVPESDREPTFDGISGFVRDPRLPALGWRGYGALPPTGATLADESARQAQTLILGVPGPIDWGSDKIYPIEANFDLLNGIDFKKGCFVGQETTSRMKRRGQIKSRMLPIAFDGPSLVPGAEVMAGDLRAGVVTSSGDGRAIALLRLDRAAVSGLTVEERPVTVERPWWFDQALKEVAA